MLIDELDPDWISGLSDGDLQMFPDLETFASDESAMPVDDILQALSSDLDIPSLLSSNESMEFNDNIALESVEDFSNYDFMDSDRFSSKDDSLPDYFSVDIDTHIPNVKLEPKTPSSLSPSPSQSSSSGSEWQSENSRRECNVKTLLETPPISPPQNESPPISPQPIFENPSNGNSIKLVPFNPKQQLLIPCRQNSSKQICLKPKIAKVFTKTAFERPRKTIVLSPQDFAALTQRVNQNTLNHPVKVQTLPSNNQVLLTNVTTASLSQSINTPPTAAIPISQNRQLQIINSLPTIHANKAPVPAVPKAVVTDIPTSATMPQVVVKSEPPVIIKKEFSRIQTIENSKYSLPPVAVKEVRSPPPIVKKEITEFLSLNDNNRIASDTDLKALKRQQRMIKNRESACLSRKKKKEYITSLENEIAELKEQNQLLLKDNMQLRQKISELEEFNSKKNKIHTNGVSKKNTAMLLATLFMVSINIGGFGVFNRKQEPLGMETAPVAFSNIRHRTLLWADSNGVDYKDTVKINGFNNTIPVSPPMCPMIHMNQTESTRIYRDLRKWIGDESNSSNNLFNKKTTSTNYSKNKISPIKRTELRKKKYNVAKIKSLSAPDANAVELFSPEVIQHAKLYDALGRKEDTFYVVWFTGEHLLLPASRKNDTIRPRMSVILPPVPISNGNYSSPPGHVTMMQIDCEVTNTQLIHLKEAVIPKNLRNQQKTNNSSAKQQPNVATKWNLKTRKPYFLKNNSSSPDQGDNF